MWFLRRLFDFYLRCSLHVALSVLALVRMTQLMFGVADGWQVAWFAFFGTVVGYNFVKYDALARSGNKPVGHQIKVIAGLSFVSFLAAVYFFLQLETVTKLIGGFFLLLTLLYTLPFFPNRKNARNWAGVKIYIVALCWVGVTVALPVIDAGIPLTSDFFLKCVQRFLLVFVLILIFEISDLRYDDSHLKTVPQQIGVTQTKWLGFFLLTVFCLLEIFHLETNDHLHRTDFPVSLQLIIALITAGFLYFSDEKKPKYYTAFWAESIPVFWWIFTILLSN